MYSKLKKITTARLKSDGLKQRCTFGIPYEVSEEPVSTSNAYKNQISQYFMYNKNLFAMYKLEKV